MSDRLSRRRVVFAVLALGLLAGCSGIKTYANTPEKNLRIRTVTKSGSIFSKVRATVDIYRVDAGCKLKYEGTVNLDSPVLGVGIPAQRLSYLAFNFASSAFLGGTTNATSQGTLLRPRVGYRYNVDVSYADDIYNVVIRERSAHGSAAREIALTGLDACKAG